METAGIVLVWLLVVAVAMAIVMLGYVFYKDNFDE